MADVRVRYLVDLVDRGTKPLLTQDRAIQRSMAQTDKLHLKLAATATQSSAQQTAAVTKAAKSTTGLASATAKTAGATQGLATSTRGATAGVETLNHAQQRALVIGTDLQHVSEAEARALRAQATAARQAAGAADMHAKAQGRQAAATQRSQATAGRGALSQVGAASAGAAGGVASRATGAVKIGALAGAVGLVAAVKQTIEFDKALRNVNSIAQLSEGQLDDVSASIRRMGGETAQAPVTLAAGMYDLVSSGFDARESMSILGKSARAATAGLTTTEVSTKAVAAVLNAYRLPADKAGKVSDQLFRTVDRGVISFESLAENVGDVLPFASSLGVGLDQVGASIATMTKAGISAPETMTRVKALMQSMLKPGTALTATLKDLGYESGEALIKQKGFQGALEALEGTTGGSKQALAELFPNVRALGGALALTGENAKVAGQDLAGMQDASGATSRALSQQSQSLSYQWQRLKAASADLGIEIGTGLKPAMEATIGVASRLVSELAPIWQRDDIDLSSKLTMSSDAASRVLGPVLAEVGRALDRMNLGQRLGQALNAAAPVIAQAAGKAGLAAVRGFFQAFHAGDPLTKTMLALFAAHKLGALRAITATAGRSAGTQFGASAAAGAAPAMATGLRGRMAALGPQMRSMGKMFLGGMIVAGVADAVTAENLDLAGRIQNAASTATFGAVPSGTEKLNQSQAQLKAIRTQLEEVARKGGDVRQAFVGIVASTTGLSTGDIPGELRDIAAGGGNVDRAFLALSSSTDGLKVDLQGFRGLANVLSPLDKASGALIANLAKIEQRFKRFSGSPFVSLTNLRSNVEANMQAIRGSIGTQSAHAKNAMGRNIGEAIKVLGKGMDDGRVSTGDAMREIRRLTAVHTGASREIVSANFRAAANAMKRQMDRGGGATREGLRLIRSLMTKALSAYGISEGAAKSLVAKRESPNYGSGGLARGGVIGGQGRRDTVPVMAAPGEAVVNRHQVPHIDRALAVANAQGASPYGSMRSLFAGERTPHYMARGGFVQGAMSQGLTGPTRQFASRMFARGYSVTDAFRPGGSTNHGKGTALDFGDSVNNMRKMGSLLIPMRRKFAELFGPGGSWKNGQAIPQIPNHMDHWHVAIGGGGVGALGGAAAEKIKRVKVRKDLGVVSNVAQGAVDMSRAAAQKKLDAAAETVGAHDGAGQGVAGGKSDVLGWLRKALNITGKFSPGNLAALYRRAMQESGGNPAAQNNWDSNAARGTPSIGLLQTIGPTFRAHALPGMDNIRNPVHNAVAAIRYMYSRYGRIVDSNGRGYAQGGIVPPFVGSYETGGTIPQDGLAHVHQGEVVIPKAMAAGGFVSPQRRLAKLVDLPLDAEIRSGRTLEGFKNVLDDLENVVPAHIASLQKRVREAMAKLRKGGITPKERERYDQLKDALAAVDEEADRRLGLIGDKVDNAVKAAQDAITGVELGLRTQGIDSGSVAGLAQIVTAQRGLHETITAQVDAVTRAVARAEREGRTDAGRELGEQLDGLKRDLLEVTADLAEKARAQVLSLAQERLDVVGFYATLGGHQQAAVDAGQRLARTADTPGGMLQRAGSIQASVIPHLRQQIAALNAQAHHALTVGAVDVWRQATEQAAGAAVQLTSAMADAADLIRDAGLRVHQDALETVAFNLGAAQRGVDALEANQRLARTADTPAAMVAQATAITTGVLPQIRAQIAALNAQAWHALSVGSIDVWRQASEQASAASTQLTSSMADAAELIRNAALKIDADAVEAAGRLVSMRDLGLTNLELRQRLADRFDTGGRERADYIERQVLPGLRAELSALGAQEAEARRQGDPLLAAQVAEAIAGKQNGLLQSQLDAQEQIRDSAQDLKEYGGTLALQSRGQQFTDFRNTTVGV